MSGMIIDSEDLAHDYDPVKAKEYYERTKKLKGRKKGVEDDENLLDGNSTIEGLDNRGSNKSGPVSESRKAEIDAEVEALKKRLAALKKILKELVDQAKQRAGVEGEDEDSEDSEGSEKSKREKKSSEEKLSAAEKRKKAKADKERYEEENPESKLEEVRDQISEIAEKIKKAREKLA